jgi:hypothetical protein
MSQGTDIVAPPGNQAETEKTNRYLPFIRKGPSKSLGSKTRNREGG